MHEHLYIFEKKPLHSLSRVAEVIVVTQVLPLLSCVTLRQSVYLGT